MKKIYCIIATLYFSASINAQILKKPNLGIGKDKKENVEVATESKAQGNIDQAKNCIKNLEEKAADPNWASSGYKRSYNTQLESLADHIAKIKSKDPKYKVSDLEESYAKYKKLRDDGEKVVNEKFDAKVKKEEEDKKNAELAKEAEKHQKVKDEGITNPTHQKYLQKIVFSSSEISKTNPNEASFASEFNINSSIYFRAYLKESIYNNLAPNYNTYMLERDGGLYCKIYVDGNLAYDNGVMNKTDDGNYYIPLEAKKVLTSIDGVFDLKLDKLGSEEFFSTLLAKESSLTPGKHKFKVEFYPKHLRSDKEESTLLADGEFTLNVTKGFVNPKDYITCMPTSKKSDPSLEAKFMTGAKEAWKSGGLKGELKKFVIRSTDWEITKNEYTGKIISRSMYGAAGVNDGGKCKFVVFVFTQDWDGKAYQSTINTSITLKEGPIFCDCIK